MIGCVRVLRPGDLVNHFTIVKSLGRGGMGEVYLARDSRLNRSVALKVVRVKLDAIPDSTGSKSSEGASRLMREAQAAAALEHPNVVTIYEVGEVTEPDGEKLPFIAMELVKGKPLRAYCGDLSVPLDERVRWVTDIARALAAAHATGLVHRDIKPENVMIRDDGVVKVLDFGLAKRSSRAGIASSSSTDAQVLPSITAKGIAVGTPYYMAPEQMRGELLDGRADQFAWGVVAYELLSGKPPWGSDVNALELVSRLLTEHPPPLTEVCPDVSPNVGAAVMRALSKRRSERYESTADLLRELGAASIPPKRQIVLSAADPSARSIASNETVPSSVRAPAPQVAEEPAPRVSAEGPRKRSPWPLVAIGMIGAAALVVTVRAAFKRDSAPARASASAASSTPAECRAHTECVRKNGGKPAVCNAGRCALVESEECTPQFEAADLESDDTVWIGTMFPMTGPEADVFGTGELRGVDLGRRDFAQAMAGFKGYGPTDRHRPIALVACDSAKVVERGARHLVESVGVPAVIGFHRWKDIVELGPSLLFPNDVLLMTPMSTNPAVTTLPRSGQRLVWRTTYSAAQTAAPLGAFVERVLEPRIRAQSPTGARLRVALLRRPADLAFSEGIFRTLRFNGTSALENGRDYQELVLDPSVPSDAARVVGVLSSFSPSVVLFIGGDEIVDGIVEPLERTWPQPHARPIFASMSVLPPRAFQFIGASEERRRRFFGLTNVSTTQNNARFVMHYNATFGTSISRTVCPNASYDSFYLLAYAMHAAENGPLTGSSLSRALARLLPPGKPLDVGPLGIFDAVSTLRAGQNIDLNGAIGKLDLDPQTGEAPVDFVILCVDRDSKGRAFDTTESGLYYDASARELRGAMHCP